MNKIKRKLKYKMPTTFKYGCAFGIIPGILVSLIK